MECVGGSLEREAEMDAEMDAEKKQNLKKEKGLNKVCRKKGVVRKGETRPILWPLTSPIQPMVYHGQEMQHLRRPRFLNPSLAPLK